jgi:hypothetical protein
MPDAPATPIPVELEHRLRPAEPVLWWGRPARVAWRLPKDPALLPLAAIALAALAVMVLVPGARWQTPVTVIFRGAIAFSAVSVAVTHLTIVWRQRQQTCYAITRDRVLIVSGFWARGTHTWPLRDLVGITAQAHADGTGSVWFAVDGRSAAEPRFEHIADAQRVCDLLLAAAHRAASGRH